MSADFDRWASGYDDSPLQPIFQAAHAAVIRQVRRLGGDPHRILDIGCGTGQLLRTAAATFPLATLIGLDPSRGMLLAAGCHEPIGFVQARAERLPFAEGCFDLVLATASYRHWSDPRAAMREISRVLTPRGRLVLADIFATSRRLLWLGRPLPASLRSALSDAELAAVKVDVIPGYGPIPSVTLLAARPKVEHLVSLRRG